VPFYIYLVSARGSGCFKGGCTLKLQDECAIRTNKICLSYQKKTTENPIMSPDPA
jgi:hypothetical protein